MVRDRLRLVPSGSVWLRLAPFGSVVVSIFRIYTGVLFVVLGSFIFPGNQHPRSAPGRLVFFFRASPTDRACSTREQDGVPPRSSQVSCNLLESLPDGIGQLMFLEHLDVSGNALVRLPSLSGLKAITRLDCAGNRLKSLPVTLSGCATLRELCCNNNPGLEWLSPTSGSSSPS